ncbi:MAG: ABC transporter substrate-binding protein, partial [Eubacterium sp.]|nr:ABC transporter substrate-binding protein [Eubacterium sp.]
KTPVIATSVTDFGVALGIDMAPTDPPGINVTGTNDLAPLADQAQQILDLFPDTKKVGCIYCSAEANSQFQVDGVKEALEAKGVECNFYSFADSNDIQAVVNKAAAESDAIYIPTDNTAASNGAIISAACKDANVPIIAGEEGIFKNTNAVATLSLSFYEIGAKAGEMAFDILVNGTDPATMNVWQTSNLTYFYNEEVANEFGITVPENYTAYNFDEAE